MKRIFWYKNRKNWFLANFSLSHRLRFNEPFDSLAAPVAFVILPRLIVHIPLSYPWCNPHSHTHDNRNQISSILAPRKFTPRNQSRASGFIAHQKLESWRAVCISPHFSNTPTSTNTHNMYKHPLYCCVCVCMWLTIMDIEIVGNLIYDMENKSWGALVNWGANWIRSKPSRPNTTADIFWMSARIIIALTANKPARRCVESHFTRNQYLRLTGCHSRGQVCLQITMEYY